MFNIQLKIQMFIYWYKGIQVFGISYLWRRCCTKTYSGGVNWCCSVAKSCPSLCNSMDYSTPGSSALHSLWVCSKSCPLSQWCYLTISSSTALFSFCLQPFPASGSFPISQLFSLAWPKYWSFNIRPSNEYSGFISFRTDWFDLYPWVIMVWPWKFPYLGTSVKWCLPMDCLCMLTIII